MVLKKYRSKRPVLQADSYPAVVKVFGRPNGSRKISFCGLRELTMRVQMGKRTMAAQMINTRYVKNCEIFRFISGLVLLFTREIKPGENTDQQDKEGHGG